MKRIVRLLAIIVVLAASLSVATPANAANGDAYVRVWRNGSLVATCLATTCNLTVPAGRYTVDLRNHTGWPSFEIGDIDYNASPSLTNPAWSCAYSGFVNPCTFTAADYRLYASNPSEITNQMNLTYEFSPGSIVVRFRLKKVGLAMTYAQINFTVT